VKPTDPLLGSPSYVKAYEDVAFLKRDELRAIRLHLELLKPELIQQEQGIRSTIVVFGSARTVDPETAKARVDEARAQVEQAPDEAAAATLVRSEQVLESSRYYAAAREFSRIVSSTCQIDGACDYVTVTGGGPGIMEAANRGAHDCGAKSLGLNIILPSEQNPNPYITPELCFQFHYFAIRKMHFLLRARALVAFPGGFGTLDELFETLTLIQTGKMPRVPVILFGKEFWSRMIDFPGLVEHGVISERDLDLFCYAETPAEAWNRISAFHAGTESAGSLES
jgi:uncharacterized protein (TIGR00730 family)